MGEARAIDFGEMVRYLELAWDAYQNHPKTPSQSVRRHDGATPYFVHPTWAAMTLMQEAELPLDLRWLGWRALVLHDVQEDTTLGLPSWVPECVRELVGQLSFGSTEEGMKQIWNRPPVVRLLAAYDKASNLLDATWMSSRPLEYGENYKRHALALAADVKENYGDLNICRIIRAICQSS